MNLGRLVGGGLLLAAACNGGAELGSSDVRLDGAGEDDAVDSVGARQCLDADGGVYVVWSDDREGTQDIWLTASSASGASWLTSPLRIDRGGDATSIHPAIGCSAGVVVVAWEDDRDGELENHNIYVNRSVDGGVTWEADDTLVELDSDGRSMSLQPQVVAAGDDVHVVWYDSANGAYDIYVASSSDGGASFADPIRVDSDAAGSAYSALPRIAADAEGHVFVVWEDSRDTGSDIYVAVSDDGGESYSTDRRLDLGDGAGEHDSFSPRVAAQGDLVYVVWHDERNGEGRDVFLSWSEDAGSSWQGAVRVDADGAGFYDSLFPDVAVAAGTAHIAWHDARTVGYDVYYRGFRAGEPIGDEVRLDVGNTAGFSHSLYARVAAAGDDVVVGWEDRRADGEELGYNDLYYNFSTDGGLTFNGDDLRIDNVDPGSSYARELQLGLVDRHLLATWTDGRRGNADVFFHRLAIGEQAEYVEVP